MHLTDLLLQVNGLGVEFPVGFPARLDLLDVVMQEMLHRLHQRQATRERESILKRASSNPSFWRALQKKATAAQGITTNVATNGLLPRQSTNAALSSAFN